MTNEESQESPLENPLETQESPSESPLESLERPLKKAKKDDDLVSVESGYGNPEH